MGQDRLTWAAVVGVLEAARDEGAALVVTTHDAGAIERADRTSDSAHPRPNLLPPNRSAGRSWPGQDHCLSSRWA